MSDRLTKPGSEEDAPRRKRWRVAIVLMLLSIVGVWVGVNRYRTSDPLFARLVGAWRLDATPSGTTDRRTVEFHPDGKFWIYRSNKRKKGDTYQWWISNGELVVVFDNPLIQPALLTYKAKELGRRLVDPANTSRSYRYRIVDDRGGVIRFSLVEERGDPPAGVESMVLTREADQPPAVW